MTSMLKYNLLSFCIRVNQREYVKRVFLNMDQRLPHESKSQNSCQGVLLRNRNHKQRRLWRLPVSRLLNRIDDSARNVFMMLEHFASASSSQAIIFTR